MATFDKNNNNNNNNSNNNNNDKKDNKKQFVLDFLNENINNFNAEITTSNLNKVVLTNTEGKTLIIDDFYDFLRIFHDGDNDNDKTIMFMNMFNECKIGNCKIGNCESSNYLIKSNSKIYSYSMEVLKDIWVDNIVMTNLDEHIKIIDDFTDMANQYLCHSIAKNELGNVEFISVRFLPTKKNFSELEKIYKKFYDTDIKGYIGKKYNLNIAKLDYQNLNNVMYAYTEQGILDRFNNNIINSLKRFDNVTPQILSKLKEHTDTLINNKQHKIKFTEIIKDMPKHVQEFNTRNEKKKYTEEQLQYICLRYKSTIKVGIVTCKKDFNEMFRKDFIRELERRPDIYGKDLEILNYILYDMDSETKDALFVSFNIIQ